MYYLTFHVPKYCPRCAELGRRAVAEVELRDGANQAVGFYCKGHGHAQCDTLNALYPPTPPEPPANRPRADRG